MSIKRVIGPFKQILTMDNMAPAGPLSDSSLEIIDNGGILIHGDTIEAILDAPSFANTINKKASSEIVFNEINGPAVLMPGLIDTHTHICYAGSRSEDYAARLAGKSYMEIAKAGGGILSTVDKTRKASQDTLVNFLRIRAESHLLRGVTTCEVKSGYGLNANTELAMLRSIKNLNTQREHLIPDLISTCLAAHFKPLEFQDHTDYLDYVLREIIPQVKKEMLSKRVDIFIEEGAFSPSLARHFLQGVKAQGFSLAVHADQFTSGGAIVAAEVGALSADHLEVSGSDDIEALKRGNVIPTVLPGASIGLGLDFAPARALLDAGLPLVIASDWNPGSAPMGDLLVLASILAMYQKVTMAETLAALTYRAATALELCDRGILKAGLRADMIAFPCSNFNEILYNQGTLKPHFILKNGKDVLV